MKWLQNNPLGMVLAATSGLFALLALVMAVVWTLPVSVEVASTETESTDNAGPSPVFREIGSKGDYQVVNEKPVFNESRQPVIVETDDTLLDDDDTIEVTGAPDVRLTGVVITPGMKIASLTPADASLESVMAHEGQSLTGEYVGWQVISVNPRNVVLESRDGQSLELELQVHDTAIKEPPKPAEPEKTAQNDDGAQSDGDSEQPLSRAEQIRQRIAERREELRLEQEAQQASGEARADARPQAAAPQSTTPKSGGYQNAIRALMNKGSKEQDANEKEDG
jgi:hypothetical protein